MKGARKKSPKIILITAASIAIIAGLILYGLNGNDVMPVQTIRPALQNFEETVTAQGKLEPKEYVDVGAQVSGQLKKIHVEIGDVVKKGDLLAEIDPKVYEARVQADEASLKSLKAQLAEQQAQVVLATQQNARNEKLIASDAISREELETSQGALTVARARVQSLKAQIEQAESTLEGDKANLSYTKIYAPMDGTVSAQTSREGQTLNANQAAPVILQLANLDTMTIRAQVAEADVMRLKPDMDVYFTTLGSLEKKWQAKIRQILPTPEIINEVVLYNALIDVDNQERQLMNGMSTQIFFVIGKADNVLTIPASALGKRQPEKDTDNAQAYVVKVRQGKTQVDKTVLIGLMNRNAAEVKSGLGQNDEVILPPAAAAVTRATGGFRGGPRL